jgi:hypothetical protein
MKYTMINIVNRIKCKLDMHHVVLARAYTENIVLIVCTKCHKRWVSNLRYGETVEYNKNTEVNIKTVVGYARLISIFENRNNI